ncbi:dodecin domain-containing protein [Marinihelvus fidelis]|uniref:Dodecin domain-containing protein n=1 Tax=Marinihelvus fidelis TaxID=2613842 RepID=A0A5N0TFD9_9GAMM|nr:dodecin family protein [Marinihelvus fidelis]KAA9133248.1 dodecin domain-containing protein [Marinihelvus fidelis]
MSIAKITEIKAASTVSFDDAIKQGVARANATLDKVKGAWVAGQDVTVEDGEITEYRVLLKVTFILN